MCGIAGMVNPLEGAERSVLENASKLLAHRGPDDEGFFIERPVGIVHRRLSIIDVEGGKQPMVNEDQSLVVVSNGEIYNFMDLRSELKSKGHLFATSSDTEVIVHAFEEWGTRCVERLQGMFAFAVYDRRSKSVFLSRDICGEKPMYYFHDGPRFYFASELPALLKILDQTPRIDPESIYLYLRLGCIPAPRSFYEGIRKVEPGSSVIFRDGDLARFRYFEWGGTVCPEKASEQELCEELDAILTESVRRMLVSDVPLGAFLSGGLDSSLIVAMMAKVGNPPKTFSISFGIESFDESHYATSVADFLNAEHTHYEVTFDDFDACLSIMESVGEPFADSSGIPTYYLARETRKKVKVALSGDGGDEIFGGYRRYLAQTFANRYALLPKSLRKVLLEKLFSPFPDGDSYYADSLFKSARLFMERVESAFPNPGIMLNETFSHEEVKALFPDLPDGRWFIQERIGEIRRQKTEALMHADRVLYLPDDILVKVDRMSMRNSLEVRVPYLHVDVLRFSERIPLAMKIKGLNLKYLLKKVALKYLPPNIVYRKKHGFMAPMSQWIKKMGEERVRRSIPHCTDPKVLGRLLDLHFQERRDNSHKIFALIVLGRFLNGLTV